MFGPWVKKIPGVNGNPLCPGNFHGQRSLVGYSPGVAVSTGLVFQLITSRAPPDHENTGTVGIMVSLLPSHLTPSSQGTPTWGSRAHMCPVMEGLTSITGPYSQVTSIADFTQRWCRALCESDSCLADLLINQLVLCFFVFFFWPRHVACRILVPQPETEPAPPELEAWIPNHWTAREIPQLLF